MQTDVEQQLLGLIAQKFQCDIAQLSANTSLRDLGADSLDAVELLIEIESEFDIDIPDDEAGHLTTLQQLTMYVHEARRTRTDRQRRRTSTSRGRRELRTTE